MRKLLAEKKTPEQVIDELYLRCLGREPSANERAKIVSLLGDKPQEQAKGLEDLFWSLLNSREFMFNH